MPEDDVTCLATSPEGHLIVGTRRSGAVIFDAGTGKARQITFGTRQHKGLKMTTIAASRDWGVIAADYPNGLSLTNGRRSSPSDVIAQADPTPFPTSSALPSLTELNRILREIEEVPFIEKKARPMVVRMNDDWRTGGDWLGRYGREWACLSGIIAPRDYLWGTGGRTIEYNHRIGDNCKPGDSVRHWVHWLYTSDRRCLEMPATYAHSRVIKNLTTWTKNRRQAIWDDHGEVYPWTMDGPHLYVTLNIPEGEFILSYYFINMDGHGGSNVFRDYHLDLRRQPETELLGSIDGFATWPLLEQGRVRDFWPGVWKRYLVSGPCKISLQVNRNRSFNTIMSSVMLDSLDQEPYPYFHTAEQWAKRRQARVDSIEQESQAWHVRRKAPFTPATNEPDAIKRITHAIDHAKLRNPAWWATNGMLTQNTVLRWLLRSPKSPQNLKSPEFSEWITTAMFDLHLFYEGEAMQQMRGLNTARQLETQLRWDGVTYSMQGRGRQSILDEVAHSEKSQFPAGAGAKD